MAHIQSSPHGHATRKGRWKIRSSRAYRLLCDLYQHVLLMSVPHHRVFIYARVSTPGQTLDPQLRDLRERCRFRAWLPTEFTDHAIGGGKESRPGWKTGPRPRGGARRS